MFTLTLTYHLYKSKENRIFYFLHQKFKRITFYFVIDQLNGGDNTDIWPKFEHGKETNYPVNVLYNWHTVNSSVLLSFGKI